MFSSGGSRKNLRKRTATDDGDDDKGSAVVQKAKTLSIGPLVASTAKPKQRDDAFYESARSAVPSIGKDSGATAPVYEDDDKPTASGTTPAAGDAAGGKLYTGTANYQKFIEKREVLDRKATSIGPIKAPSNVRLTCRFDYQPDLCKDYKETGYCGFGDACKFMHDRGDYKAGWELDRDWKLEQEKKKLDAATAELEAEAGGKEAEEVDDGLPFACAICRGPFRTPVETKCSHYFCEPCALAHYGTSRRCFVCNEQTYGIFNTAIKLEAKIKRLKARTDAAAVKDAAKDAAKNAASGDGAAAAADDDDDGGEEDMEKMRAAGKTESAGFRPDIGWQIPGNTFHKGKDVLGWGT